MPTNVTPVVFEAIVRQQCITGIWNRSKVVLAPHVVYTRHGELFVDAITVARDNMLVRQPKLGTFKLGGLGEVALSQRAFEISDLFEPEAERYDGATLLKVERAAA